MKSFIISIILIATSYPVSVAQTIKSGQISGVITYFFNDNFGNRPDVGSEVFIYKAEVANSLGYARSTCLDTFRIVSNHRELERLYKELNQDMPKDEKERINKYGIDTDDQFEALDKRTFIKISKDQKSKDLVKTAVDGNGRFSVTVPPGTYTVLIISSHRQGISISEVAGKFYHENVKVQSGAQTEIVTNFEN